MKWTYTTLGAFMVLSFAAPGLMGLGCGKQEPKVTPGANPSLAAQAVQHHRSKHRLVEGFLSLVQQPEAAQFTTPESAVEFLLTQVKLRDLDRVTQVFPIREHFERVSLRDYVTDFAVFHPQGTPVPGADFQRLGLATRYLTDYERLSIRLLGIDPGMPQPNPHAEELLARLDFARLRDLKILSVKKGDEIKQRLRTYDAIGVTTRQIVNAKLQCCGKDYELDFEVVQIGEHWKIMNILR